MNLAEARTKLCQVGWLSRCPDWFRAGLLERASIQHFRRGERVHNSGPTESSGLWGIADGIAGIGVDGRDRPDAIMHLVGQGFWGGALELILGGGRKAFLSAVTPLSTLFVPAGSFRQMSEKRPEAWQFMAVLPALNNATALRAVEDMLIQSARHRLSAVLLRLSASASGKGGGGAVVVPLSQERIAEAANMSRTVAVEILADLESSGAVEKAYGAIKVFPDRLAALVQAT